LIKKKDNRPSPVRLSKKSLFILEKVKVINDGIINKAGVIETALCNEYPLFAKMYDKEKK
tara:strand:- start:1301 stop:1480 length:180 start_codon:yes stop_codon:yes gene_type:complete